MVERYFEKFNTISYNGYKAVNLLSRVTVSRRSKDDPFLYYDYQVKDGQRADFVAYKYYDDAHGAWLIYLSNDVIDPYYQWKLDYDTFNNHIVDKYGSLAIAKKRVLFYRNNWYADERQLSVGQYQSSINTYSNSAFSNLTKYWTEVDDGYGNPMYYVRTPVDWTYTTNIIESVSITYNSNSQANFVNGGLIDVLDQYQNYKGGVEVAYANNTSNVLTVKNVTAGLSAGYVLNGQNGESATVVSSTVLQPVIPNTGESVYYEPVYAYDYELEQNSNYETIKVMSKSMYVTAANELKQDLA